MNRRKITNKLRFVGTDPLGFKILRGCFIFESTLGLSLDIIVEKLYSENIKIDWLDFYIESVLNNSNYRTVLNKISYALYDVFGKEYRDVVIKRLEGLND